jgi:hypothetical protein
MFPHLLETGQAEIIEDMGLLERRLGVLRRPARPQLAQPSLDEVFARLRVMAVEYSSFARGA